MRCALALGALASGFCAQQALAFVDTTAKDRRGDVTLRGAGSADRKALDIRSVRVLHHDDVAVVEVQFVGDFEARVGRRALRRTAAVAVLRPARGRPSAAATAGGSSNEQTGDRGPGSAVVHRDGRILRFAFLGVAEPKTASVLVIPDVGAARARSSQAAEFIFRAFEIAATGGSADRERAYEMAAFNLGAGTNVDRCASLMKMHDDLQAALDSLEDRLDRTRLERVRRRLEPEAAKLKDQLEDVKKRIAALCFQQPPAAGDPNNPPPTTSQPPAGDPPPSGDPPPTTDPPPPFGFGTRPTTGAGDFFLNTQWHTLTTGSTTQQATTVEIEVPPPWRITGFYAKSGGHCKLVGQDGTEYTPDANGNFTIPPGTHLKAVRCPGKDTREIEFRLKLDPAPTSGMQITVRATRDGVTVEEMTTYP